MESLKNGGGGGGGYGSRPNNLSRKPLSGPNLQQKIITFPKINKIFASRQYNINEVKKLFIVKLPPNQYKTIYRVIFHLK